MSSQISEPPRPLEECGMTLWRDVHGLGEVRGNVEPLLRLCEQLDERADLRKRVAAAGEWRDRVGLRQLDDRVDAGLKDLRIRALMPTENMEVEDSWAARLAKVTN